MPGAHSYLQFILTLQIYTIPWPRMNELCKEKSQKSTGAWAATAGPCCSCQQDSPCNLHDDPGAHGNEQGGKAKQNGAKWTMRAAGMAWQRWAGKRSLLNKAAAGKHSRQTIRPAQALKKTTADDPAGIGLAAKQPADEVGRPLAVQCRLVEGVRWCWPHRRRARTYLPVSLPPIAFACLCPYPLP